MLFRSLQASQAFGFTDQKQEVTSAFKADLREATHALHGTIVTALAASKEPTNVWECPEHGRYDLPASRPMQQCPRTGCQQVPKLVCKATTAEPCSAKLNSVANTPGKGRDDFDAEGSERATTGVQTSTLQDSAAHHKVKPEVTTEVAETAPIILTNELMDANVQSHLQGLQPGSSTDSVAQASAATPAAQEPGDAAGSESDTTECDDAPLVPAARPSLEADFDDDSDGF